MKILPNFNLKENYLNMQIDYDEGESKTTGNAILEFDSYESAVHAQECLNKLQLDKAHTFTAYTFDQYDEILATADEFVKPNFKTESELYYWIDDVSIRDQFILKDGDNIVPYWFNNVAKNGEKVTKINKVGIKNLKFTGNGRYLMAFDKTSVSTYGGDTWDFITKFAHPNVKDVKLSPLGNYILTYNGTAAESNSSENIIVWNFITGKRLRLFQVEKPEFWDSFQFSFDEKYLAGIIEMESKEGEKENILTVFDPQTMSVIIDPKTNSRRPIQITSPQCFKWANHANLLVCVSYAFGEDKNGKSSVTVVEIPTRKKYNWTHFTID